MASLAAKARLQTDRLIRRGKTPIEAFNAAIEAYKVETGDKNGSSYAKFTDRSYLELRNGELACVLTSNASRSDADKIIRNIFLLCSECSREIWCDHNGRGRESDRFQFGDATVYVCMICQRGIVERYLVGE